jgi:predicted MPP superfamily phosphohydrolase
MSPFTLASGLGLCLLIAFAARAGGVVFARFVALIFGVHTALSCAIAEHLRAPWLYVFAYLQCALFVHLLSLTSARSLPSLARKVLIAWPGSVFSAGTFLALPWVVAGWFVHEPPFLWVPYFVALLGAIDSFVLRTTHVHVALDGVVVPVLARVRSPLTRCKRPLRIVQITDPHLGSFMSEERLRRVCERAVAQAPDLVVLTGDLLTMESHNAGESLTRALAPLLALKGRVFACMGNHDHEAPVVVAEALAAAGATLLIDAMATVTLDGMRVDVIGYDFHWRDRARHLASVSARLPRSDGAFRLALLHDPGAFVHLPDGAADLVLSGHTHGGQVGLVWLGLHHTVVSALSTVPDHGFWGRGSMRLYVHRGTGHYGFPVRVGVPPEESVLYVHHGALATPS